MAEYIDRVPIIKKLEQRMLSPETTFINTVLIRLLQGEPTADVVKVKHGKWIERENNYDTYYDCSVCSESFVFVDGDPIDNLYQYCPNCGAKMDGKED